MNNGRENITYLIGAGASADALPIGNNMKDSITEMIRLLIEHENRHPTGSEVRNIILQGRRKLAKLSNALNSHISIDTYAKKLFLTQRWDEYREEKKS